ncbi:MAG: two-component system response regulator CreB [Verrucomicrobiota bacterium JB023]|nr:two-component system response regulator CreB [Verrucomicrobiota bacterium JB023]
MPEVLIIEDERAIADTLVYALQTEGFTPHHRLTGREGLSFLRKRDCDFLVLDIGLPDIMGFDVCREVREFSQVPVLFLTARDSEVDQVLGLELGADDYVTKPFSPRAVVARLRAILRRADGRQGGCPEAGTSLLEHDLEAMVVRCRGVALKLTAHEYKLLATLMGQPDRVFTRDQLLMAAWEDPGSAMDRTVDAHIKSLRSKIRATAPDCSDPIQTRRGLGYTFSLEEA